MERYTNKNGDFGDSSYETSSNFIQVGFTSGSVYDYTYSSADPNNIEKIKALATNRSGLNSFIKRNVDRNTLKG